MTEIAQQPTALQDNPNDITRVDPKTRLVQAFPELVNARRRDERPVLAIGADFPHVATHAGYHAPVLVDTSEMPVSSDVAGACAVWVSEPRAGEILLVRDGYGGSRRRSVGWWW